MSGWVREGRGKGAKGPVAADGLGALRLVPPLGQGEALQRWLGLERTLRLPHGMLVEGSRGSGTSTVLGRLAAALLCP